jgi:hypothetical protein
VKLLLGALLAFYLIHLLTAGLDEITGPIPQPITTTEVHP